MQTNDAGEVALRYFQPVQKYVAVHKNEYVFVIRADISMAWIKPEDVDVVLSLRRDDCPCAQGNAVFRYANEDDVRRWTNGGGR